jgi:excisionase family DNA binding protein
MIILQLDSEQLKSIVQDAVRKAIVEHPQPTTAIPENNNDLLSINEATIFLNLAKPTIYGLVCHSKIPCMKKGKKLYFSRQELLTWIKQGKKKTLEEMREDADNYLAAKKKRG